LRCSFFTFVHFRAVKIVSNVFVMNKAFREIQLRVLFFGKLGTAILVRNESF